MKTIPELGVRLARVDVVRAAKSVAVVQKVACVGNVCSVKGNRPALAEALADGQVKSGMRRKMGGTVRCDKPGAELIGGCCPKASR
jgi:hypothetical protein